MDMLQAHLDKWFLLYIIGLICTPNILRWMKLTKAAIYINFATHFTIDLVILFLGGRFILQDDFFEVVRPWNWAAIIIFPIAMVWFGIDMIKKSRKKLRELSGVTTSTPTR